MELSDESYPVLIPVDWQSDIYWKPHPGVFVKDTSRAVDKAIGNDMEKELSPKEDADTEAAEDEEWQQWCTEQWAQRKEDEWTGQHQGLPVQKVASCEDLSVQDFKKATHEERMRYLDAVRVSMGQ